MPQDRRSHRGLAVVPNLHLTFAAPCSGSRYKETEFRTVMDRKVFSLLWLLAITLPGFAPAGERPDVMLAKVFQAPGDVTQYWVSEKLDGVRARWDGKRLISRGGTVLQAPDWFVMNFPAQPLDGELWIGRGQYEQTVSVVRRQTPHAGWRKVKLMVFDLPAHPGVFDERVLAMRRLEAQATSPYLAFAPQFQVASRKALRQRLDDVIRQGGEGLMLHRKTGLYRSGRSADLLKLKPFDDAEATVIGYRPGKGRFSGKMGALKVRADNGQEFFIGTGFSLKEREQPPPVGSVVTFRHQGFTGNGIPRFAVFLRVRDEP